MATVDYRVWSEDRGQEERDGELVQARNPKAAAELWAATVDAREVSHRIACGDEVEVRVRTPDGHLHTFIVLGSSEVIAHYEARKVL